MKFVIGFLLIILGGVIIRYRYHIYNFTGDWGWAQKYLGGNGTVTAISLIGAILIFAGFAYPFGAFDFGDKPIGPQFGNPNK
ncbi:hypothetical protein CSB09_01440 [Candidatus Gracilibacteria bacterium]|nr:MAG: hypothetical protein CSB09_01440 [Candidatus Gracilibacteria bacterium]